MSIEYDFSRQLKINGMNDVAQAQLKAARILVFGAGGLGATCLPYLAAAGIGHLTIVDDDTVELSNLHRQIPFTYADIGEGKAELMRDFCRDRSPYGEFIAINHRLSYDTLLASVREHDIVIDCTDDRRLAYQINDAALITATPAIFANAAGLSGQMFVMQPALEHPCWRCLWPETVEPSGNCNAIGVLGPVPATLGCWQALATIKLITKMPVSTHEMLYYDFASMRQQVIRIQKSPQCNHHINDEDYRRTYMHDCIYPHSIEQAKHEGMVIVDIRRPEEWAARALPQADECIEMMTLLQHPERYLQKNQRYLLVCAAGVRSRQSAEILTQRGYDNVFAFPSAW